jgi:hypothetical protein
MILPFITMIRHQIDEILSARVTGETKFSRVGSVCFVQQETIETRLSDFRGSLSFFPRVSIVPNR